MITKKEEKKELTLDEAVELVSKEGKKRKFVEMIDVDVVLNIKESQKKETVRGVISFPHQFGKSKRVVVICEEADKDAAVKAGATKAGEAELIDEINNGFSDFDVLVTTPKMMPKIARLGKVLGPRGLMPNPSNGTITDDIKKTIEEFVSGKSSFKMDSAQGAIRMKVAAADMKEAQIKENLMVALKSIFNETKRFGGAPWKKLLIKKTMGPSIKLNVSDIIGLI